MRNNSHRPALVRATFFAAALALLAIPAAAQDGHTGRTTYGIPPETERGDWAGTWVHIERDKKVTVWIRHDGDGPPRLKMQFFSVLGDEQFRTDWNSKAEYQAKGTTGYFTLTIDEGDANVMNGGWDWRLEFPESGRTETSNLKIYRTGDGRAMAFVFDDWVQTIRRGKFEQQIPAPHVWTFRKISKRELIWDELPF